MTVFHKIISKWISIQVMMYTVSVKFLVDVFFTILYFLPFSIFFTIIYIFKEKVPMCCVLYFWIEELNKLNFTKSSTFYFHMTCYGILHHLMIRHVGYVALKKLGNSPQRFKSNLIKNMS